MDNEVPNVCPVCKYPLSANFIIRMNQGSHTASAGDGAQH